MRRGLFFIVTILASILLASIFGIIHDQITYTISPEYYTKFKFVQFDLVDLNRKLQLEHRFLVTLVGIFATWWTGLIIGAMLGFIGLFTPTIRQAIRMTFQNLMIIFLTTAFFSVLGFVFAKVFPPEILYEWFESYSITDSKSFMTVGYIHNASYIGGLVGLILRMIQSFVLVISLRKAKEKV